MRELHVTPAANDDIGDIIDYIWERNERAADKLFTKIADAAKLIQAAPGIGHRHRSISDPTLHCYTIKPFLIVYEYNDENVTIVRVVDGRRDLKSLFD